MDRAVEEAIAQGRLPGGVLWLEHRGQRHVRALGRKAVEPSPEPMTPDTIFDLASLTKVVATAPSVALLAQSGALSLDDPVARHIPGFGSRDREPVRIVHLLTHTSGLPPGLPLADGWEGVQAAVELACAQEPEAEPGARFRYSDINFILLGEVVRRVSGQSLDRFARERIFGPLGMSDTGFLPPEGLRGRIAPTTRDGGGSGFLRGRVHDPTARRMGGVAGHAGLFSTASDLAAFARMLLAGGRHRGAAVLEEETVALMSGNRLPGSMDVERGLGWDIESPYSGPRGSLFSRSSYGHTGWTGTSLWIDPGTDTFVIFLSNRNHPTEEGSVLALRRALGTLAAEAIASHPFPGSLPPRSLGAPRSTRNGIDVLKASGYAPLRGRTVGLITNHTGRDREGVSTIDLLHRAPGVRLARLFSPEHGIRGKLEGEVSDSTDPGTGLPVASLYGATRKPEAADLEGLDALVFDIQDIGCRFYTYISTLLLSMEAAHESGLEYFVLDRINPVSGAVAEGPVLLDQASFVACHPIPLRHGMTVGELARLFAAEKGWELDLEIVGLEDWDRGLWQDETSLPWRDTSPNMRSLAQALLYPGVGLLEFADLSVGRGTPAPFERIGAPWIDSGRLVDEIRRLELPGVRAEPIRFVPESSKHAGKLCHGARFEVTDRDLFRPTALGAGIASILHRLHPAEFDLERVRILLRHPATLEAIRGRRPLDEILAAWEAEQQEFAQRRQPHLLYPTP